MSLKLDCRDRKGGGEDSLLLEFTSTFAAAAAAAAGGDECSLTDTCGFNKDIT